jgi:hypothetical protein
MAKKPYKKRMKYGAKNPDYLEMVFWGIARVIVYPIEWLTYKIWPAKKDDQPEEEKDKSK